MAGGGCANSGGGAPMQALAPGRWRPSVRHWVAEAYNGHFIMSVSIFILFGVLSIHNIYIQQNRQQYIYTTRPTELIIMEMC